MRAQIVERLKALKSEYDAGQKMLAELEARRASLANTLLRIDGAIQVLDEMARADERADQGGAPGAAAVSPA